jgi:hypothetical protein
MNDPRTLLGMRFRDYLACRTSNPALARLASAPTTESAFSVFAAVDAPPNAICPCGLGHVIHLPDAAGADHAEMRKSAEWFSRAVQGPSPASTNAGIGPSAPAGRRSA